MFIPIDGVDFAPYVTLLLTSVNEARIADKVIVVTDGDKGSPIEPDDDPPPETGHMKAAAKVSETKSEPLPGERRKLALETLSKAIGAQNQLTAIASTYSLEAELLEAGNNELLPV